MNLYYKIIVRIILVLIISLLYFNFRNNQCIKNENCKPFFITNFLTKNKIFNDAIFIDYLIFNDFGSIDIKIDKDYDKNSSFLLNKIIIKNINEKFSENLEKILKKNKNANLVDNNSLIVKRFVISNKTIKKLKIKSKIIIEPNNSNIKIYNCFCNKPIYLEPFESKNLYIYYSLTDLKITKGSENSKDEDYFIKFKIFIDKI